MVFDAKFGFCDRKQFRPVIFDGTECINNINETGEMSSNTIGRRRLLRLNHEIDKRNSGFINDNSSEYLPTLRCTDENRNSVINAIDLNSTDVCEVTTTEITERKTRKRPSAIHTIRNLVRATVITSSSGETSKPSTLPSPTATPNIATTISTPSDLNDPHNTHLREIDSNVTTDKVKVRKKKTSLTIGAKKNRKYKRNRRSRAIQNEGASLWTPLVRV